MDADEITHLREQHHLVLDRHPLGREHLEAEVLADGCHVAFVGNAASGAGLSREKDASPLLRVAVRGVETLQQELEILYVASGRAEHEDLVSLNVLRSLDDQSA